MEFLLELKRNENTYKEFDVGYINPIDVIVEEVTDEMKLEAIFVEEELVKNE